MTLTEYPDVIQGSKEWHDQRRGIVTASVVGKLVTPSTLKPASNDESRGLTALLVAERITGYTDPTYMSNDMAMGVFCEPIARQAYSEHFAPVRETGFMIRVEDDWKLGFSPDGLVGDDGLIEIKTRRQKTQLTTILADEVPRENMAQIQAGLLVTGREWLDYISFCGGMPLYPKRVYPDPRWQAAIIAACRQFEATAIEWAATYRDRVKDLPMTERIDTDLELVV